MKVSRSPLGSRIQAWVFALAFGAIPIAVTSSPHAAGAADREAPAVHPASRATRTMAGDLYFHGMTDDQAQKENSSVNGTAPPASNLTFSASGPNVENATPIQQVMGNPNPDFIPNQLAIWWVGDFSGTIDGDIRMDWTWQTSNADGALQGVDVSFAVVADPDFANAGVGTQNVIGRDSAQFVFSSVNTPATFTNIIHGVHGTVASRLLIQVSTHFINTGPGLTALYDSPDAPSRFNPYPNSPLPGACCDPTSGTCRLLSSGECAAANGIFQGPGTECSPGLCSIVTPCVLPGVVAVTDPPGASDTPPVTNPQQDLQSVSFAEPYGDPLGDVFVITMKTAGLNPDSLPPNTFWRTSFTTPLGLRYYVSMVNCATGGVSYEYGHYDANGSIYDGPADAGTFSTDGSIRITVTKDKLSDVAPGGTLTPVDGDVRVIAGDCPPRSVALFGAIDTSTPGTYLIRGNDYCAPPTVSCPADFTGAPGDYDVSFTVHNPSTTARTYQVTITDPEEWLVSIPIVDVLLGPVAAGDSQSLSGILRMAGDCNPAVDDLLDWSVTALDLPAPSNVASCQTTATCFQPDAGVGGGVQPFSVALLGSNPFREQCRFRYTLPAPAPVKVEVFGIRGERLRTLVDARQDAGTYDVSLRLRDGGARVLGPGVYLVRITAGSEVRNLRVVGLN